MFSQYHVLERIGEGSFGKVRLYTTTDCFVHSAEPDDHDDALPRCSRTRTSVGILGH